MDRWKWKGIYTDGTEIVQGEPNPATGKNWSSDHLDLSKLSAVVLEPQDGKSEHVILHVQPGQKPRRFWRQYIDVLGGTGEKRTCWVLSLEENGITFHAFFRPDGTTILTTDPEGSEYQLP